MPSIAAGIPGLARQVRGREPSSEMHFEVIGEIEEIQAIAKGPSVRERTRLLAQYGEGRWRKMKGKATVRLASGATCRAEVHWCEAHGIGRKKLRIKRFLE